jgi:carbamate kinase
VVAENDPAFNNPTKPVGSFYTWEEVQALGTVTSLSNTRFSVTVSGVDWFIEKRADAKAETPYRRVVPSPKPLAIHPEDMQKIRDAIAAGKLVIACGGGGVPVIKNDDGSYTEVAGVIDKDLASAVLSAELEARELIISTGDLVTPFFRIKENERLIGRAVNYIQLQYALCDLRGGKISKSDLLDAFGERGRLLWKGLRHSNFISGGYLSGTASIHANLGIIDQRGFNAAMKDSWVCPNNAAFSDAELSATYQMVQSALRGQYPAGSMGEKIEAAVNALRRGVNTVMISHPNMAWIKFEGTLITRGFDLTGRIYNAGRIIGNWMEAHGRQRPSWLPDNNIQRWLV